MMSRICHILNKKPLSGNNRSHSMRATRRVQNVNLQKFKMDINGKKIVVRMSAKAHRNFVKKQNKIK